MGVKSIFIIIQLYLYDIKSHEKAPQSSLYNQRKKPAQAHRASMMRRNTEQIQTASGAHLLRLVGLSGKYKRCSENKKQQQ